MKQFLLSSSPPDFNKFVHEIIKDKTKIAPTSSVIGAQNKYLKGKTLLLHLHTGKTSI